MARRPFTNLGEFPKASARPYPRTFAAMKSPMRRRPSSRFGIELAYESRMKPSPHFLAEMNDLHVTPTAFEVLGDQSAVTVLGRILAA